MGGAIPLHVELGPLSAALLAVPHSRGSGGFPASQAWADEFEALLALANREGQLKRFESRLRSREWSAALAEIRTALFLSLLGFSISGWEPEAIPGHPGDLEAVFRPEAPVFVEVKQPGWQGELHASERDERKSQAKYINGEGRSVDPMERVMFSVDKALPKLAWGRVNLVAVVDDLFTSPLDWPADVVSCRLTDALATQVRFSPVSAVLALSPVVELGRLEYRSMIIPGPGEALPPETMAALTSVGACPRSGT